MYLYYLCESLPIWNVSWTARILLNSAAFSIGRTPLRAEAIILNIIGQLQAHSENINIALKKCYYVKLTERCKRKIPILPFPNLQIYIYVFEIICPAQTECFCPFHWCPDRFLLKPNPQCFGILGHLGRWQVMQAEVSWMELVSLQNRPQRAPLSVLPCDDRGERCQSINEKAGPYLTPDLLAPWPLTSQPPELQEINLFFISYLQYLVTATWMA